MFDYDDYCVTEDEWLYLSDSFLDHPRGNRCLTLTQRQSMEALGHSTALCQLQQGSCGILQLNQSCVSIELSIVYILVYMVLRWYDTREISQNYGKINVSSQTFKWYYHWTKNVVSWFLTRNLYYNSHLLYLFNS